MINKSKISKYIKKLRLQKKRRKDGKPFTQDDLAREFYERNAPISINAIAEWESGATLPSPDNLEILAEIYGKSLDEILDGEDIHDVDYAKIYFLSNPNWTMGFDQKSNLYQIRNEQIELIIKRFQELILARINRAFSTNEENEFRFLFENFYQTTKYIEKYTNLEVNNEYFRFKDALSEMLVEIRNMNQEEKYWEIQKLFSEKEVLRFSFRRDVHDLRNVPILQERFSNLEDWQKDMLLAMFQSLEPFDANPDKYGSSYLKRYEAENGEYDHESIIKSEIREIIKRGACLNKCFFSIKEGYFKTMRIIDRLEELHKFCCKPIEISIVDGDGNAKPYLIENNMKNRFLNKYYFTLRNELNGYDTTTELNIDIEDIYKWFLNNDDVSEETYLNIAKRLNIDVNRDKKYWLCDVKQRCCLENRLKEYKENEKAIADALIEIEDLKARLAKGENKYKIHKYRIIGGSDESSIRAFIECWKCDLDYSEYLRARDKALTKKLLSDLDVLSMKEIKEKYFEMEVIENE